MVLHLFLQHYFQTAADNVLLVGVRVRRLATAGPSELGLGEPFEDATHGGHSTSPRRLHLVEGGGGVQSEPELCRLIRRIPPAGNPNGWYGACSSSTALPRQASLANSRCRCGSTSDHSPSTRSCSLTFGNSLARASVAAHSASMVPPGGSVVVGDAASRAQPAYGVLTIELGLDIPGHLDVVDDNTVEVTAEIHVAAVAVDDLQTTDLKITDFQAGRSHRWMRAPRNWSDWAQSALIEALSRNASVDATDP